VPFRTVSVDNDIVNNTTTVFTVGCYPNNMSGNLPNVTVLYEFYRFLELRVKVTMYENGLSGTATYDTIIAISYDRDYNSTAPSSLNGAAQANKFVMFNRYWPLALRIGRGDLTKADYPWMHTTATGSPPTEIQGNIYVTARNKNTTLHCYCTIEIEGVCEFAHRAASTSTVEPGPHPGIIPHTCRADMDDDKKDIVTVSPAPSVMSRRR